MAVGSACRACSARSRSDTVAGVTSPETRINPDRPPAFHVRRFTVRVVAGPDVGAEITSDGARLSVGSADDASLRLTDPYVSRYHVEVEGDDDGVVIRDLGSRNGTRAGALTVREVTSRTEVELELGRSKLRVIPGDGKVEVPLSVAGSFGSLVGASRPMREVYATLERAAPSTVPVLITGESGTGKELAARSLHAASARARGPFEVIDCGAMPPTLIEAELFGYERGAFTGARGEHAGAFERADKGTVFLDELGELPLELQPRLLRALGEGEVRRIGATHSRKVDVRVVAATNRDLRREVNDKRFRLDLYYRLAVVKVQMPSLRDRLDDLPALVAHLATAIERERAVKADGALDDTFWAALRQHHWPGNVRELRNYLEQWLVLRTPPTLDAPVDDQGDGHFASLMALPLREAKQALTDRFERAYLQRLLEDTQGNVAEAARRAGVDRVTIFRGIRRYGLREEE
jgi:two-component system, NtrC family, response regulator GlrR